ncbi:MAG: hypothetical protein AB1896_16905 [Thermodesulfobacteriota bacterium]
MTEILSFARNRCTTVHQSADRTLESVCRLQDTLTEAEVRLTVALPDLDITAASGRVHWSRRLKPGDVSDLLVPLVGVRIGQGLLKIIKGLLGEKVDRQISFMVEECCQAVILAFTRETLAQVDRETASSLEFFRDMVRNNIRLYGRCAAFAEGSRLVEGLEPPQ